MTARQWFQAYTDAVGTAGVMLEYTRAQGEEASEFWRRTLFAYRAAKGLDYADSVAVQTDALLLGVDSMRKGVVP